VRDTSRASIPSLLSLFQPLGPNGAYDGERYYKPASPVIVGPLQQGCIA
jgi:hypothetical protein